MANGGKLSGKPTELVQAALKLDPNHQRPLALAASAAFNSGDYPAAIGYCSACSGFRLPTLKVRAKSPPALPKHARRPHGTDLLRRIRAKRPRRRRPYHRNSLPGRFVGCANY